MKNKIITSLDNISKIEWSAVLFYTEHLDDNLEGHLEAFDMFLMDIGNTGATDYLFTEEVSTYMMENDYHLPEAKTRIGLIHSHHTMGVFFSSTDKDELVDNSEAHDYYLSLIVNNKREAIAKVVVKGTSEHSIEVLGKKVITKDTSQQLFSVDVTVNGLSPIFHTGILNRIEELTAANTPAPTLKLLETNKKEYPYLDSLVFEPGNKEDARIIYNICATALSGELYTGNQSGILNSCASDFVDIFGPFSSKIDLFTTNLDKAVKHYIKDDVDFITLLHQMYVQYKHSLVLPANNYILETLNACCGEYLGEREVNSFNDLFNLS